MKFAQEYKTNDCWSKKLLADEFVNIKKTMDTVVQPLLFSIFVSLKKKLSLSLSS